MINGKGMIDILSSKTITSSEFIKSKKQLDQISQLIINQLAVGKFSDDWFFSTASLA